MSSPSMQPEHNKPGKSHPNAGARRGLLGDPAPSVDVILVWATGGVTATFPQSTSSAEWDSSPMAARSGSTTTFTGTGRNATNSLSAVINGSSYLNNSIADNSITAKLTKT